MENSQIALDQFLFNTNNDDFTEQDRRGEYLSTYSELILPYLEKEESIITAPFGSGKTYSILKLCLENNIKFVFAVPLTVIAQQNIKNLLSESENNIMLVMGKSVLSKFSLRCSKGYSKKYINDFIKRREEQGQPASFIVVYDSIPTLLKSDIVPSDYLLIIDEAHMLVTELGYRNKAIEYIIQNKRQFRSITHLTATAERMYVFENLPHLKFYNQRNGSRLNITLLDSSQSSNSLLGLANLIKKFFDQKLVIYINDIRDILTLYRMLLRSGFNKEELIILHSKTKDQPGYKYLVDTEELHPNAKVILTTNVIAVGANIRLSDIDYLIMYHIKDIISRQQMIGRFRDGIDNVIDIVNFSDTDSTIDLTSIRTNFHSKQEANFSFHQGMNNIFNSRQVIYDSVLDNYRLIKKIDSSLTENKDFLQLLYESIMGLDVNLSELDDFLSYDDADSLLSETEFTELSRSFWDDRSYYEKNLITALVFDLEKNNQKIFSEELQLDPTVFTYITKIKSISDFDEYLLKEATQIYKEDIDHLKEFIRYGFSIDFVDILIRNQSRDSGFLSKAKRLIDFYFQGKVLLSNLKVILSASSLQTFFVDLLETETDTNLLNKYHPYISLALILKIFEDENRVYWREIDNIKREQIRNLSQTEIPQISISNLLLSQFKPNSIRDENDYTLNNADSLYKRVLPNRTKFKDILQLLNFSAVLEEDEFPLNNLTQDQLQSLEDFMPEASSKKNEPRKHPDIYIINYTRMVSRVKSNYLGILSRELREDFPDSEILFYLNLRNSQRVEFDDRMELF